MKNKAAEEGMEQKPRGRVSTGLNNQHRKARRQVSCLWKNGWRAALVDRMGVEVSKDENSYSARYE